MLIAVISDTHNMKRYIELGRNYIKEADVLIHLGDNSEDIKELTRDFTGDVYGVSGNCDYSNAYPMEQVLNIMGKKIFLTHGHIYGVKENLNNIYYRANELNADIVLFGHTHENLLKREGEIVFMNPGSISLPRLRGRYVGFIELEEEKTPHIYLKEVKAF
ncbi:metallophosphoesterase [Clostridium vincentii]|uniref:metallophosphoesterase n=1 Tax=Clostridium vincentii TaxID=52704 RepID=UPI000D0367B1|nr:metallophosphoesterase [Clostridium vincentii]